MILMEYMFELRILEIEVDIGNMFTYFDFLSLHFFAEWYLSQLRITFVPGFCIIWKM